MNITAESTCKGTMDLQNRCMEPVVNEVLLSVIIPAYNERNRLPPYLRELAAYLKSSGITHEIIVVDDGSNDDTVKLITSFQREYCNLKLIQLSANRGKGYAVKTGMLAAVGKYRLFTDADGAISIDEIGKFLELIKKGADVVIGSKALSPSFAKWHRKLSGRIFNTLVHLLAVKGIRDTQCGFKLFTAEAAQKLFSVQTIDGYCFDVEILFLARLRGYIISETPVVWSGIRGGKVRILQDSCKMTCDLFRIRKNLLSGIYGGHND